jgi:hypothetical protein
MTETLVSLNKNVLLNTTESFKQEKYLLIDIIFAMKKVLVNLYRAAPYMLTLVLNKDALFHFAKKFKILSPAERNTGFKFIRIQVRDQCYKTFFVRKLRIFIIS